MTKDLIYPPIFQIGKKKSNIVLNEKEKEYLKELLFEGVPTVRIAALFSRRFGPKLGPPYILSLIKHNKEILKTHGVSYEPGKSNKRKLE